MSDDNKHTTRDLDNGWEEHIYAYELEGFAETMWTWMIIGNGIGISPIRIAGISTNKTRKQAVSECYRKRKVLGI